MITLIFVVTIFILSILFSKTIHKFNYFIYAFAFIVALAFTGEKANVVSLGYIPLSFFLVVMYTGVLGKGKIKKKLMTVRAENAVLGSIFLIPHAYGFLEFYLEEGILFETIVPVIGLLSLIVLIPLFITSFRFIRRHFTYKQWKKVHEYAYLFYFALSIHLIYIDNSRQIQYLIIFGVFFALKGYDKLVTYKKQQLKIKKKMI